MSLEEILGLISAVLATILSYLKGRHDGKKSS
jgi:hypothetical protein